MVRAASAREVWACRFRDRLLVALVGVHLTARGSSILLRQMRKIFPAVVLVALTRDASSQFAVTHRGCGLGQDFDTVAELGEIIQTLSR